MAGRGWHAAPDVDGGCREHDALCALLADAGADVVVAGHDAGNPDAIYVYDPVLVGREGAVLLRPGKVGRLGEPDAMAVRAREAPASRSRRRIEPPAAVEGGDTLWLDETTLLVGVGYRTNQAGVEALRDAFPGSR